MLYLSSYKAKNAINLSGKKQRESHWKQLGIFKTKYSNKKKKKYYPATFLSLIGNTQGKYKQLHTGLPFWKACSTSLRSPVSCVTNKLFTYYHTTVMFPEGEWSTLTVSELE